MRHTASSALSRTLPLLGWCPSSTTTAAATCKLLSSVRYASSIRAATPAWDVGAGVLKGPRPGHKGGSDRPSSLTPKPERPRSGSPLASTKRSGASSGGSKAALGEGAPTSMPRRQLSAELKSSGSAMEVLLAATSALHASNLRNKSTALHAITTKVMHARAAVLGSDSLRGVVGGRGVGRKRLRSTFECFCAVRASLERRSNVPAQYSAGQRC